MTIEQMIKEASDDFFKSSLPSTDDLSSGLEKVASLPYKEESYEAVCGIMKLASERLKVVEKEVENLKKISSVRGVIDEMMGKGLIGEFDIHEKTAFLLEKNAEEFKTYQDALALNNGNTSNVYDEGSERIVKTGMFDGVI